ncbi:MAG: type III-A CRISPR-associated RAMP protein Csm3 [Syntrophobacterales bacterium]|nr:type III-A CRISPR-associated RAMP protein Csm3 [Syntrophobacterales bacterium]
MQLINITEITGTLIVKTGLRIGAGDTEMRIGGLDNPIIKHPHTLEPYIPGSSLKGKVRSLLEMKSGLMGKTKGEPLKIRDLQGLSEPQKTEAKRILKLFGAGGAEAEQIATQDIGPTRVAFADCPLEEAWRQKALEEGLPFTEVKSENAINRIEGVAQHPRFMERIPAGARFAFRVTLKTMAEDEKDNLENLLLLGLKLLTLDALGGCGSRGYGRISLEFHDPEIKAKFDAITPFAGEG